MSINRIKRKDRATNAHTGYLARLGHKQLPYSSWQQFAEKCTGGTRQQYSGTRYTSYAADMFRGSCAAKQCSERRQILYKRIRVVSVVALLLACVSA